MPTLLIMGDYGAESVVWFEGAMIDPRQLRISPALAAELEDLARAWNEGMRIDAGWKEGAREEFLERAHSAADRARLELGPNWRVDVADEPI